MEKQIELYQKEISYVLNVSARAKRLRLAIYRDGRFVVTAPRGMSAYTAEQFIHKKSQWIINKLEYFKNIPSVVLIKNKNEHFFEHKDKALALVETRLHHFNQVYNFSFNKISIKNQRTRWGSCSSRGNLNFNYKIVLLPERLADYIIVHELCHLRELNHSKKFWDLVAQVVPDYAERKNDLKKIRIQLR